MRTVTAALPLFALLLHVTADELPPHVLNLARISRRMADELKRLPDYTCLETIDRYTAQPGGRMKPSDRIRINVAIVDGKELYAWPGAKSFDDRSLGELVRTGFISDGDFASMARNVFVNRTANIVFVKQEMQQGRALLHYDFEISPMRSGWHVRLRNANAVVGAKGVFFADAATLDLARLNFAAQDLPPFSPDKRIEESVEYGRVRLGNADILLPLAVDLEATSFNGESRWNHTVFSGCRQYGAETSIFFGDDNPTSPVDPVREDAAQTMPAGIAIPIKLETQIDSAHAAVGDEIRAVVSKNVRLGDELLLPRGALVKGVIRRLDRHLGNRPYFAVGIEFNEAQHGLRHTTVFGKLGDIANFTGLHRNVIGYATSVDLPPVPGVGYFYVEGESFVTPKGLSLTWLTQSPRTR